MNQEEMKKDLTIINNAIIAEDLNDIYNKKQSPEDTAAEMLNLLDENREVVAYDSALKESHRLLSIWSRTETETAKYLAELKTLLNFIETKTYEVCFRVSGSVTVTAENQTKAMEYVKSSDHVSTYDLFEGISLNIIDAGNDAISIDHVYETEATSFETKHAVVSYTLIRGESRTPRKRLISFTEDNIDLAIHEFFKSYWDDDKTHCGDTGYRYNRTDWEEAIHIERSEYVSAFEAEILKRYME